MKNIEIPGGTATLCSEAAELSPRRRREVELLSARLGPVLQVINLAGRLLCEGDVIEDRRKEKWDKGPRKGKAKYPGPDLDMTENQLRLLNRLNDAIVWVLLVSWSLARPLPATPDDLLDLPADLYDSLRDQAAATYLGIDQEGGFTAAALPADGSEPDTSLPTSA